MARAIWSGTISFGLVSVPVKAYTAVKDHDVHFHRVEKGTGARVRNRRVSEKTGDEVDSEDVQLGYELSKGHYVTFDKGEIDDLRPASTRSIDVSDFVPLADIDPVYYQQTYWLAPDGDDGKRAYGLLLTAMEKAQRVAIGSVVMRTKQHLTAVRPLDGVLAMSTMRFADEVVPRSQIDGLPKKAPKADAKEVKLATQIIDALAADWDPARYHDTYTEELEDLIARKAEGEELTVEPGVEDESADVIDLMEALQASVDRAKQGRRSSTTGKGRSSGSSSSGRAAKGKPATKAAAEKKASASSKSAKKATGKKPATKRSSKAGSGRSKSSTRKAS